MSQEEICFLPASELVSRIKKRELSVQEIMEAHLLQMERVNPKVNAVVTSHPERSLDQAKSADRALSEGKDIGPLFGLPVAHKDLALTKGVRTTFGSLIYKDNIPDQDGLVVERLKKAGAISIGKTNVPEFGAGSNTFNEVFGDTLNPYDLSRTCGGSSGGAAVALACGMAPFADGSDLGGSLRNPANFCNVVGFRPSPGRVPRWPNPLPWCPLPTEGPMARTVEDTALMLSVIAGPDPRSPIAIREPGTLFNSPLKRDFKGVRIAWGDDFGGLPIEKEVKNIVDQQKTVFKSLGCVVEENEPDFSNADQIFKTWRSWLFYSSHGALLKSDREQIKDTVIQELENGQKLTGIQLGIVEKQRTELYHRVRIFLKQYDFMIFPVSQVLPFDVKQRYVTEIDGVKMHSYLDWMRSCYFITITGLPAISVPCGFSKAGLPVGIQIVGRHEDDFGVLQLAYAYEQITNHWRKRPAIIN